MRVATFVLSLVLSGWTAVHALAPTSCGNSAVDAGEDCDDGAANGTAGDCCTASCTFATGPCDDGDACTTGETCNAGVCGGGQAVVCPPSQQQCREPFCDSVQGCLYVGKTPGTPCTDGNACTIGDQCSDGVCLPGQPVLCGDDDPCTIDSCKDMDGTPVCKHAPNPDCPACGNNVVDPGETCDPPDATIDPATGQAKCRPDCTFCGDGIKQAPETCDDGNRVSGCDPNDPSQALDPCQNNCTRPICRDPAIISLRAGADQIDYHGRLVLADAVERVDADQNAFVFRLTAPDGTVLFETSLPVGALVSEQRGTIFAFRDPLARGTGNGVGRVLLKYRRGAYGVSLRAYGDLSQSEATMTSHVLIGQKEWTIAGTWTATPRGWRLTERGTVTP